MSTSGFKRDHLLSLACQVEPRVGDQFTLASQRGNPFDTHRAEVIEVRNGWVLFACWNTGQAQFRGNSSCEFTAFGMSYEPTLETIEARKHAVTVPDYLAYLADQRQVAEDEAKEMEEQNVKWDDKRQWESGVLGDQKKFEDDLAREAKRRGTANPQD